MKILSNKLFEIEKYLVDVIEGRKKQNLQILHNCQEIMNLLPNTSIESMVKSFAIKSNDHYHAIYIASLVRSVMSLHKLINNKLDLQEKVEDVGKEIKKEEAKTLEVKKEEQKVEKM